MVVLRLFLNSLILCAIFFALPCQAANQTQYTYDLKGRLTGARYNNGAAYSYTYGDSGNLLTAQAGVSTDSDHDGLPDSLENEGTCPFAMDLDSDEDGLLDGVEDANQNGVLDPGETDPCKIDTDGDGIQDGTELGITPPVADPDGSGPLLGTNTVVFQPDLDPSEKTNPLDVDSDGDGVTDGNEDTNHNGRLDAGETRPGLVYVQSISGRVTQADGSSLTDEVTIKAYSGPSCEEMQLIATAWSDADSGAFLLENLGTGPLYLYVETVSSSYLGEWWSTGGDAYDCSQAQVILPAADHIVLQEDILLDQMVSISGAVYQSDGTSPAVGTLYVNVYRSTACSFSILSVPVNPLDGTYSIEKLLPGTYFLKLNPMKTLYLSEWWAESDNSYTCETAGAVLADPGDDISGKNFVLETGTTISGTIYQNDGVSPAIHQKLAVFILSGDACTDEIAAYGLVDEVTGTYTSPSLQSGEYTVKVVDLAGLNISKWWSEGGNAYNCLQAETVTLVSGSNITNKDFQLAAGGLITGTVFQSDGKTLITDPVDIEFYQYYDVAGGACKDEKVKLTVVRSDPITGQFRQELPEGAYFLRIDPASTDRAVVWYNDSGGALSCTEGKAVTILPGETAAGIDFHLEEGKSISGTIYHSDGVTPASGMINVIVYTDDTRSDRIVATVPVDPVTGRYSIGNLGNYSYLIKVDAANTEYADEWYSPYGEIFFSSNAQYLKIENDQDEVNKDFSLDLAVSLSGIVYQEDGVSPFTQPVTIGLWPKNPCSTSFPNLTTNPDPVTGDFSFDRIGPGTYALIAYFENTNYFINEWWSSAGNAFICTQAEEILLAPGDSETGKIFKIDQPSTLSGTVYKADGVTPMDQSVRMYLYSGSACSSNAIANTLIRTYNGSFRFLKLKPGTYYLKAVSFSGEYVSEWWSVSGNSFSCTTAQAVTVESGKDVSGIDLTLDPSIQIIFTGTLDSSDNTFARPSTSYPDPEDCRVSTTTDKVYYDVHTFSHPAGEITIKMEGTDIEPVVVGYNGSHTFNPAEACENIQGVMGCSGESFEVTAPISAGTSQLVVTTCHQLDVGSYKLTIGNLPFIPGDMDGDGKITLADVISGLKIMSGQSETLPAGRGGDVDYDGKISTVEIIYNLSLTNSSKK